MSDDLLFEIGCEELPASYVDAALQALPGLVEKRLADLRLTHAGVEAWGTPRRLAVLVHALAEQQADVDEAVKGPPENVGFKDGKPTKAAEGFAKKIGVEVSALAVRDGYLEGRLHVAGKAAVEVLPEALAGLVGEIPFKKSMRWGAGDVTFGRPLRWLSALFAQRAVHVKVGDVPNLRGSFGHRFLHPGLVSFASPGDYKGALRVARVVVDPGERRALMVERLHAAAASAGGTLIEDEFLIGENLSLCEEPQVVVGSFEDAFLALPEEVILAVARGHQRYFGLRSADGKLMPRYLAVVNTAQNPAKIALGNDRVMRARLADARFFHEEDMKRPLAERRKDLAGIVFQNRLGSVLDKVARMEKLAAALASQLGLDAAVAAVASGGAALCKCDLVTLMVGELPELQGQIGRYYAARQGVDAAVCDVIRDHYQPKGAADDTAPSLAGALVALADRLDTLVGCFAIGLSPTGGADPYGLRRACIGTLRTLSAHGLDLSLRAAFDAAYGCYDGVALDLDRDALAEKLGAFFRDRQRGLLTSDVPADVADAALGTAADRPLDAAQRARAILSLDRETRDKLGEVFKRASNITKDAPDGEPTRGTEAAEHALYDAFFAVRDELGALSDKRDYAAAFGKLAGLAPLLGRYFDDVMVMHEDPAVRDNRLRLMRTIRTSCSALAKLEVLGSVE